MADHFYTLLCDYRGGTYASQFTAKNLATAVRSWADLIIREKHMGRSSLHVARNIQRATEHIGEPVPLTGLSNIWFMSASSGGSPIGLNIIKTVPGSVER